MTSHKDDRDTSAFEFDIHRVDEALEEISRQDFKQTNVGELLSVSSRDVSGIPTNTMLVMERLANHPDFQAPMVGDFAAPHGRFRGRHIIGTGTRVLGGVFLGHHPREALIVDETDPKLQKRLRSFIRTRMEAIRCSFLDGDIEVEKGSPVMCKAFAHELPQALFAFTRTYLVYDEPRVAHIFREAHLEVDAEFSLDHYLRAHYGVCRQMVLFLVAMFELLEKQGLTEGRMFLCRCYIPHLFSHAWARHESSDGLVFILDPAQDFLGRLDEGGAMGRFIYGHECAKLFSESTP